MSDVPGRDSQQPDASVFPHLLKTFREIKPSLIKESRREGVWKFWRAFLIVRSGNLKLLA